MGMCIYKYPAGIEYIIIYSALNTSFVQSCGGHSKESRHDTTARGCGVYLHHSTTYNDGRNVFPFFFFFSDKTLRVLEMKQEHGGC